MKSDTNYELSKFNPHTLVSLFEIDMGSVDGNTLPDSSKILYFHNSKEDEVGRSLYFGLPLREYLPIPVEFVDHSLKGDGTQLPRPKLKIGNADGLASYYIRMSNGLVGSRFTRRRVFAKNLHQSTWGGTNPWAGEHDPDAQLAFDVFYVESIIAENKSYVEIELASSIDVYKVKVPRRRMYATNCSFEYRNGTGCGYSGAPVAKRDDVTFSSPLTDQGKWSASTTYSVNDYVYLESSVQKEDGTGPKRFYFVCVVGGASGNADRPINSSKWEMDACSLKINGCRLRFGSEMETNGLPFGGFPALQRVELDS